MVHDGWNLNNSSYWKDGKLAVFEEYYLKCHLPHKTFVINKVKLRNTIYTLQPHLQLVYSNPSKDGSFGNIILCRRVSVILSSKGASVIDQ